MQPSSFHYMPLEPLFFLGLAIVFGLLVGALQVGILGYAYEKMGLSGRWAYGILLLSLVGSYVNIPVAEVRVQPAQTDDDFQSLGVRYALPEAETWPHTILAVNLGGAVIPTFLSIYLMVRKEIVLRGVLGLLIVAIVVHALAQPIPGKGIAVPILVPPIVSALVAMVLSRQSAAPLAYISGSLGTLLGADLMNLHRLAELGAPIASIGGAGTFDGIFLTGILAVLLAH